MPTQKQLTPGDGHSQLLCLQRLRLLSGWHSRQSLLRQVKPLIETRELTKEEKEELAGLFERYQMRLTSKLRRSIGAALEAEFDADDVLSEAYIRAETRWFARPAE